MKECLKCASISKSTYHYITKTGKSGRPPSTITLLKNGKTVNNREVISKIEKILDHPFVDYGYLKMTHKLRQDYDMIINPKKVFRLMKESNLLQKKEKKRAKVTHLVSNRKIHVSRPFELIEIDIKYIYVEGDHRHYYMLNLLDCYSWKLISYKLSASITKREVIKMLKNTVTLYGFPKNITLRSDNGSQFIAKDVEEYVNEAGITHEFTHIATPEENGFVESFHSILSRFLRKRGGFSSFFEMENVIRQWVEFYNVERLHKGCNYRTPNFIMNKYFEKKILG